MLFDPVKFVRRTESVELILNISPEAFDEMYTKDSKEMHPDHPRIIYSETKSVAQSGMMMSFLTELADGGEQLSDIPDEYKAAVPIASVIERFEGKPEYYFQELEITKWPTKFKDVVNLVKGMDDESLREILIGDNGELSEEEAKN